jgi:hypothetical protein
MIKLVAKVSKTRDFADGYLNPELCFFPCTKEAAPPLSICG